MYLERTQIRNFRGIRSLEIAFERDNTTLIGENSWGKSSLLRALWMMLGRDGTPCVFAPRDLYVPIRWSASDAEVDDPEESSGEEQSRPPSGREVRAAEGHIRDYLERSWERPYTEKFYPPESSGTRERDDPSYDYYYENARFMSHDVYEDRAESLTITLTFSEAQSGDALRYRRLRRLAPLWRRHGDGRHRIIWRARGLYRGDSFITVHEFLDARGRVLKVEDQDALIALLISMNPVLRIRDSRMPAQDVPGKTGGEQDNAALSLSENLVRLSSSFDVTGSDLQLGLQALDKLTYKYLTNYNGTYLRRYARNEPRKMKDVISCPVSLESLSPLQALLNSRDFDRNKILATYLLTALTLSKGMRSFDAKARPIMIFEDIESRFHPSLLLSFWSVVNTLPAQKIVTTNSGDFLTALPLRALRRLCRQNYDTRCYAIKNDDFSAADLRRIAFHIRINRPTSLFARTWVLVEGETEIWLISEIASLLGFSLPCSGVRLVEFAQCGLSPLLRFVRKFGISFFVMTDGDEAGGRYAATVRSYTDSRVGDHLFVLPNLDIEHFFYANGFADVFREASGLTENPRKGIDHHRIIETAIRRLTKPGLALALVEAMQTRGRSSIPRLFIIMMSKIRRLSRYEFGFD